MENDLSRLSPLLNKRIIVTGAGGMLSGAFEAILKEAGCRNSHFFRHSELDVNDREKVLPLSRLSPDIILHCAANVNVDGCEDDPESCMRTQCGGTRNVLDLARASNTVVFYPQTFLIYGGGPDLMDESTAPFPLCQYGRSKLEAEKLVLADSPRHLVVRMGGMFGGLGNDKNFVGKFARQLAGCAKDGVSSKDVVDRVWQPTFTGDLAYNALVLLAKERSGVYCMASHGEVSFYNIALEIISHQALPIRINRISAAGIKEKASRPQRAVMRNSRLISEGLDFQRGWKESLHDYLDDDYFKRLFA